jgi:hypothetical protein
VAATMGSMKKFSDTEYTTAHYDVQCMFQLHARGNAEREGRVGRAQASIQSNSEKNVWILNMQLSRVPKIYSKVSSLSIFYRAARQGVTLFRTRSPECGSRQLLDDVGYVDTSRVSLKWASIIQCSNVGFDQE